MRSVHLSPDSGGVDVQIDGSNIATNLRYLSSSPYESVGSGTRVLDIFVSGNNVFENDVNLSRDTDYTVLLAGFRGSLFPQLLTDDNSTPPSGQFRLRFLHEAPNSGTADLYALTNGADINTAAPNFVVASFGTNAGYVALPAGNYDLQLTPTGAKTVVVDSGPVTFSAGQVRTVVLVNAPAGSPSPFTFIFLNDAN
jgi:hypothetical protein